MTLKSMTLDALIICLLASGLSGSMYAAANSNQNLGKNYLSLFTLDEQSDSRDGIYTRADFEANRTIQNNRLCEYLDSFRPWTWTESHNFDLEPVFSNYINEGASINTATYGRGITLLMRAVGSGNAHNVQTLIDNGADANCKDLHGYTPLMHAANKNHIDIVRILINAKANVNMREQRNLDFIEPKFHGDWFESYWNALSLAARHNHTEIVKILIDAGADVNINTDKKTNFPLINATQFNHHETADLLIKAGADIEAEDDTFGTALHSAVHANALETVDVLIKAKANLNWRKSISHFTPLMNASFYGHTEMARKLINAGAFLHTCTTTLSTALSLAITKNHWAIAESILNRMHLDEARSTTKALLPIFRAPIRTEENPEGPRAATQALPNELVLKLLSYATSATNSVSFDRNLAENHTQPTNQWLRETLGRENYLVYRAWKQTQGPTPNQQPDNGAGPANA